MLTTRERLEKSNAACAVFVLAAADGQQIVKVGYASKIKLDPRPLDMKLDLAHAAWFADAHVAHRVEAKCAQLLKKAGKHIEGKFYSVPAEWARRVVEIAAAELVIPVLSRRTDSRKLFLLKPDRYEDAIGDDVLVIATKPKRRARPSNRGTYRVIGGKRVPLTPAEIAAREDHYVRRLLEREERREEREERLGIDPLSL